MFEKKSSHVCYSLMKVEKYKTNHHIRLYCKKIPMFVILLWKLRSIKQTTKLDNIAWQNIYYNSDKIRMIWNCSRFQEFCTNINHIFIVWSCLPLVYVPMMLHVMRGNPGEYIGTIYVKWVYDIALVKLLSDECQWTILMISQHWFG